MAEKEPEGIETLAPASPSSDDSLAEPVVTFKTWIVCAVSVTPAILYASFCDVDRHRFSLSDMAFLSGRFL